VPITFDCTCGRSLRVGDENAGRRVKCPACGAIVIVPKPQVEEEEPQFEVVEDEPQDTPRPRKQSKSRDDDDDEPPPRKKRSYRDDDDDDDEPPPKKKKSVRDDDDDDDEPPPKKKKSYRDDDDDDEPPRRKKKKRRRRSAPTEYDDDYRRGGRGDSDLSPFDWFLCVFCSGIGCIVGLVRMMSGSPEGGKMVGISLVFIVIWNALRFGLAAATK